jgi:hypothetical protein
MVARDAGAAADAASGQERTADKGTSIRDRSRLFELAGRHFALEYGPVIAAQGEELVQFQFQHEPA